MKTTTRKTPAYCAHQASTLGRDKHCVNVDASDLQRCLTCSAVALRICQNMHRRLSERRAMPPLRGMRGHYKISGVVTAMRWNLAAALTLFSSDSGKIYC